MNAFEEFMFDENYVLRFYRVDHGLVCTINESMVPELREVESKLRQQQAEIDRLTMLCDCMTTESNRKGNEIEALNELNTMLKDAIEKRIEMDANRYQWLRAEFAAGRETYLAEGIPSGESLDKYIDGKLK